VEPGQSFKVRSLAAQDEAQLNALLRKYLRSYRGPEKWNWIFQRNPTGSRPEDGDVLVAETNSGEIIGCYSKLVYGMRFFGESCLGAQGGGLIVDEGYRRLGVATELVKTSRANSVKRNFRVTFSFPNRLSQGISKKLQPVKEFPTKEVDLVLDEDGYLDLRYGDGLGRTIRSRLRSARARVAASSGPPKFQIASGFSDDAGRVWESLRSRTDVGIERSLQYLTWRYSKVWDDYSIISALDGGRTQGYIDSKVDGREGAQRLVICDLAAFDDNALAYRALLSAASAQAQSTVSYITASASATQGSTEALRQFGFRSPPNPFFWMPGHGPTRLFAFSAAEADKQKLRRATWHYAIGDRDTT